MTAIRGARAYLGDRLIRVARPHRLTDSNAGPLVAVRLQIVTRKTLGGGGVHEYRALEGTFLGGCMFSGRSAGTAAAKAVL